MKRSRVALVVTLVFVLVPASVEAKTGEIARSTYILIPQTTSANPASTTSTDPAA